MKVLVVDDHILFREGLVSLLRNQPDFDVLGEAGTVREAISQAALLKPDLILLDFTLPDGNGLEATEAILALDPNVKIVFLTVHESDDRLFSAVRAGARGYLLKNLSVSNLLASLRALERGEAAISRVMMGRILEEFSRDGRGGDNHFLPVELTTREMEILQQLSTNASNREIAGRLYISENTVKNHVHNILEKLKLSNRREAVDYARRLGVFPGSRPVST